MPEYKKNRLLNKLDSLTTYGFCKSHSLSYAQLVYHLAYFKVYHPEKFWKATLNNCCSSYRKWVHLYEAKLAGVNLKIFYNKQENESIYAQNRKCTKIDLSCDQQIRKFGYWQCNTNCFYPGGKSYYFNNNNIHYFMGLIASYRILTKKKTLIAYLGVGQNKYIEIIIKNIRILQDKFIGIKGNGILIDDETTTIKVDCYSLF